MEHTCVAAAACYLAKDTEAGGPDRIFQIAFGFRSAKALLTATELGLFAVLTEGPLGSEELVRKLGLHGRGARDFFDALVALGLLHRDERGRYRNAPDYACYLDPASHAYVGGILEYLNGRIYDCWGRLSDALRSGRPHAGPSAAGGYEAFYGDAAKLDTFLRGMSAGSLVPARALADAFPWKDYRTVIDIGTAQGCVPVEIARRHSHLTGGGFDLPIVGPSFTRYVSQHGLADRLRFHEGDFFGDPLPAAEVLVMGRILHNWDLDTRKLLLRKAYDALPPRGQLIVYETLIDDDRRERLHSLLASLNMLLQTDGGSEFTGAECATWLEEAGFAAASVSALGPIYSAVIGTK